MTVKQKQPHHDHRNKERRRVWGSAIPLKGTPSISKKLPNRPYLLKLLPPPSSIMLESKVLIHGNLGDKYSDLYKTPNAFV